MMLLIICSILLNFSNCAVIRKAQTLPSNIGEVEDFSNKIQTVQPLGDPTAKPFNWWNKILTTRSQYWNITADKHTNSNRLTVKPFDKEKSTVKTFDWDRFTAKPFDWDKSTAKPFDLSRFTAKPFHWDKSTAKPFNSNRLTFDWNKFTVKPFDREKSTVKTFDWDGFTAKPFDWDKSTAKPFNSNRFTFDWNKFTAKPFDWNKFTMKPFDWDKSTAKPFDWNRFTFDWDRFTVKPFEWDRITYSPNNFNYHYKNTDDTSLKVAIFLPITFAIIIGTICKYFVCNGERNSNTSTPILHPPPRRTVPPPPPPENRREQNRTTQTHTLLREDLFSTTPTVHSTRGNAATNIIDVTDKPPGYSDVIMGDFGHNNYFPEVKPKIPETPPPQYDENNVMRY